MMPRASDDVLTEERRYYNRYGRKSLAAPLLDAKQMVLFSSVPLSDAAALTEAMAAVQQVCTEQNTARVHSVISDRI
ncbi:hypothetical protein HNR23_003874 [Nocardiopsis mwathae]|uniref:Uncharacterized protein n=1 Tax=Nocardiopsis mwathae TaxID=1472723 RepID=A0A7W9YKF1_9ACTN|nr:hypothetical protein [Nocardiopsis mwathae]MBB6173814.1 hypothetical protein [Nocardiopsis mwathae]